MDELKEIEGVFLEIVKEIEELENTSDFIYYLMQIAGRDSRLHSFKPLVQKLEKNNVNVKDLISLVTKKLSKFVYSYHTKGLSFFYPVPSNKTREEFFNEPVIIINKILKFGIEKGKIPIPDPNPIYEAFGICFHFPEFIEEFRNTLFLLYRNIILRDLFYPLIAISEKPISKNIDKGIRQEKLNNLTYEIENLFRNIFVIESEIGMVQGTAFHLKGIGIITCDHCIRNEDGKILSDIKIFRGSDLNKKYDVEIVKTNKDLDVAILNTSTEFLDSGLTAGVSSNLIQLQEIGVAGYPNYNFGDHGFFYTGKITGFRNYCGIRHILVSCPLISGNSGGPAFNDSEEVIGIVMTGADKMSKANETEKHGLIPIEIVKEF